MFATDNSVPKTYIVVSSIKSLCCLLDKRDIRRGLGSGDGRGVIIPLLGNKAASDHLYYNKHDFLYLTAN